MASGYDIASGVDLDTVFAPQHPGWSQAPSTEFFDFSGNDLNLRYAALSTGSAAEATHFVDSAGNDLNTLFAAYGSTSVQVLTQPGNVSGSAAAGNPSGTVTSNAATCAFTKGSGSYTYTWHCTNCTANSPNSATTTFSATVSAGSTDNASAYCAGSDGVTSANTNAIAVTLQNTTTPYIYSGTVTSGEIQSGSGPTEIRQIGWAISLFTGGTVMGSISPSSDINGNAIAAVYSGETGSPVPSSYGMVLIIAGNLPQGYFTTLTANGSPFSSSSASYSYSNGYTSWTWTAASMTFLASGQNYPVLIQ